MPASALEVQHIDPAAFRVNRADRVCWELGDGRAFEMLEGDQAEGDQVLSQLTVTVAFE